MTRAALVTGAASGIGRAIAARLGGDGLQVLSRQIADQAKAHGVPAEHVLEDVCSRPT